MLYEKSGSEYKDYIRAFGAYQVRIDGTIDSDVHSETGRYYYHTDHLGSIEAATDETGAGVWTANYSAFGEVLASIGSLDQEPVYTGKGYDEDVQLYYFNARWYDPELGRFISEDPIQDGTNWYVYVSNNPLKFVDPTGLDYIYLNDNNWAFHQGHAAVIVGNDQDGYTYYSKDGPKAEGSPDAKNPGNTRSKVMTREELADYMKKNISPRYETAYRVETTAEQDAAMRDYGDKVWDSEYGFADYNCGDQAKGIGVAGGLPFEGKGTVLGITRPNSLKKDVKKLAEGEKRWWEKIVDFFTPETTPSDVIPEGSTSSNDDSSGDDDTSGDDDNGGDDEGSIICTELYRQGLMSEDIYQADELFGRMVETNFPLVKKGYLIIARPIVSGMRKSHGFSAAVNIFAKPWSLQMAYMVGFADKQNLAGAAIMIIGVPLCFIVGFLCEYTILLEIMVLIVMLRKHRGIAWN
ncbi:RHS repeat-associated core domain-containing protein [Marispirochaeta sp.]|uniref:RHS repeat domain-containing protein n=1 Tax=Marispirochaeta sp. TaxID=2038653 RepID=UPI0029C6E18B|nr:RHS repeat-associated core domain-containing protein [Marispirochaeta sp.]